RAGSASVGGRAPSSISRASWAHEASAGGGRGAARVAVRCRDDAVAHRSVPAERAPGAQRPPARRRVVRAPMELLAFLRTQARANRLANHRLHAAMRALSRE